jgi:hypothetical protein
LGWIHKGSFIIQNKQDSNRATTNIGILRVAEHTNTPYQLNLLHACMKQIHCILGQCEAGYIY